MTLNRAIPILVAITVAAGFNFSARSLEKVRLVSHQRHQLLAFFDSMTESILGASNFSPQFASPDFNEPHVNGEKRNKVPHILYFVYKENILQTQKPREAYSNIINTIQVYQRAWNETHVDVRFVTDDECIPKIRQHAPSLQWYFLNENFGPFKSDICRIVALYETGGYYFDNDMVTEKAWMMEDVPNCSFSTAKMSHTDEFFQSFIAAEPRHAVLKQFLQKTVPEHYERYYNDTTLGAKDQFHKNMGPKTLAAAYRELNFSSVESESDCLLREKDYMTVKNKELLEYPRRLERMGCQFAVYDSNVTSRYFWSRIHTFPGFRRQLC